MREESRRQAALGQTAKGGRLHTQTLGLGLVVAGNRSFCAKGQACRLAELAGAVSLPQQFRNPEGRIYQRGIARQGRRGVGRGLQGAAVVAGFAAIGQGGHEFGGLHDAPAKDHQAAGQIATLAVGIFPLGNLGRRLHSLGA